VSASNLNFGSVGVLRSAVDASSSVTVTCTNALPYTVALDGGLSGATNPTLRVLSQASQHVTYGLYRDSPRAQPWGDSAGTNTAAGTGSGLAQTLTVYGRVPAQNTPSPGTYSDTTIHIHHKANSIGSGHAAEDQAFLQAVADSVAGAGAILITGPANAKTELVKHIHRHDPKMMNAVAAVETVDHPSDGALLTYARKYFQAADRMNSQMQ
jgi:hypothetical protein